VEKFRADRPTELGDLAQKKRKETSAVKHKAAGNYGSGQPNNIFFSNLGQRNNKLSGDNRET